MNLGELLQAGATKHRAGDLAGAETAYQAILQAVPEHFDALHLLGVVRLQQGRLTESVALIERAISRNANIADAYCNLGSAYTQLGKVDQAVHAYDQALSLDANNFMALNGRATALLSLGRHADALATWQAALRINASASDVLSNIGFTLAVLGRDEEAVTHLKRALAIDPLSVSALRLLLISAVRLKQLPNAFPLFERASALAPQNAEIQLVRGLALRALGRHPDALAAFERALVLDPRRLCGLGETLIARRQACAWPDEMAADLARLQQNILAGEPVEPFAGLVFFDDPALQQQNTRAHMAQRFAQLPPPVCTVRSYNHARPRIAYLSGDFREHPAATLNVNLFERHDHNAFEFFGVSYGPDDGSAVRMRITKAFGTLHDVSALSDRAVAEWLAAHEIDIAIDLSGYMGTGRVGIFAHRGAPIQVNCADPGTAGVTFMDYMPLADDFVIPPVDRDFYDEKVVYMPDTYQVTDAARPYPKATVQRQDVGLPVTGFVFCCFNSAYKITPEIFDVWMRLLRQVGDSVLWLRCDRADTRDNLRRAAQSRKVAPDRIIFASRVPEQEHFARQMCADLALDTIGYSGHATASDTLWAGVPLITCAGRSFAARAGGSILRAAGLADLVVDSLPAYEALALSLARDPARLAPIRARVAAARMGSALFDTDRFRRNIESAYRTMLDIARESGPPRAFTVAR